MPHQGIRMPVNSGNNLTGFTASRPPSYQKEGIPFHSTPIDRQAEFNHANIGNQMFVNTP